MIKKDICVLFDMDGVILDTESQYDVFWKHAGDKYNVGIDHFEKVIKGTTLTGILKKYFSHLSQEELDNLINSLEHFEANMSFLEIEGAIDFVKTLKNEGIKIGLVTSSMDTKMIEVNKVWHFEDMFDTIVSGSRVVNGKPHPDCYLLAAKDLGIDTEKCIVFEDSFAGIEAGQAAGMQVIGLSTTHAPEIIRKKGVEVIPNFKEMNIDYFLINR